MFIEKREIVASWSHRRTQPTMPCRAMIGDATAQPGSDEKATSVTSESNDGPRRARLTFVAGVFNEASQTNSPTMCELVWPARVFGSLPARVPDSLSSVMD